MIFSIGVGACLWFGINCYYHAPIPKHETKEEIIQYLKESFETAGLDSKRALEIARCESNYNIKAVNINKNGSKDSGIFQINSIHKLPDECSFDLTCSADWVIKKVKRDGGWDAWVCNRKI